MQLTFSLYSVAGLLIMMGLGLIVLGIYQRWLYPTMRRRHEKAKVTGSHGRDPADIRLVFKSLALLVLPTLGFLYGDTVLTSFFG